MASRIYPDGADPESYRGLPSIYEFINSDGGLRQYNCGHAAACSFLTFNGDPASDPDDAGQLIRAVEEAHPPDNMGGWFGVSRRRMERICRAHGIELEAVEGEEQLRASLATNRPVIVVTGMPGPRVWRWHLPKAHWMVAYGYDDRQIFLTNWSAPAMTWPEFRGWWNSFVPGLIHMRNVGLAAVPVR
jgi:hypothetical protein